MSLRCWLLRSYYLGSKVNVSLAIITELNYTSCKLGMWMAIGKENHRLGGFFCVQETKI